MLCQFVCCLYLFALKDWASNNATRSDLEDSVLYAYYGKLTPYITSYNALCKFSNSFLFFSKKRGRF